MSESLVVSQLGEDGVLSLSLNRPAKRNALNPELFAALGAAFSAAAASKARVILLRGEGPVFCAGIDLASLAGGLGGPGSDALEFVKGLQDTFMALERQPIPSICAVRGAAVGAGFQLALGCDLRVVADNARLGMFEVRYGIIPDLTGLHRVARLSGASRAKDLAMTGRELGAEEALRIGVADRVVPEAEVEQVARQLALEVAARSSVATSSIHTLVDRVATGQDVEEHLREVALAQRACFQSPEFATSLQAGLAAR
ncbi:MAG: enoyl-CoA hydratase/isomerase family protein [Candidatus Dormibacteria bacterium]